jgi:hypothetical protein
MSLLLGQENSSFVKSKDIGKSLKLTAELQSMNLGEDLMGRKVKYIKL